MMTISPRSPTSDHLILPIERASQQAEVPVLRIPSVGYKVLAVLAATTTTLTTLSERASQIQNVNTRYSIEKAAGKFALASGVLGLCGFSSVITLQNGVANGVAINTEDRKKLLLASAASCASMLFYVCGVTYSNHPPSQSL